MPKTSKFKQLVVKANNIIVQQPRVTFTAQEMAFKLDISPAYAREILSCLPSINQNILVMGGKAQYIGKPRDENDNDSAIISEEELKDIENILKAKPTSKKKKD